MYLPNCYSMRFTILSNYYLINWWCNNDFCLFACWIDFRFSYSYMTWETGGLELVSTIILVLPANRLTKCASHPKSPQVTPTSDSVTWQPWVIYSSDSDKRYNWRGIPETRQLFEQGDLNKQRYNWIFVTYFLFWYLMNSIYWLTDS